MVDVAVYVEFKAKALIKELSESRIWGYIIVRSDTKPNRGESPP